MLEGIICLQPQGAHGTQYCYTVTLPWGTLLHSCISPRGTLPHSCIPPQGSQPHKGEMHRGPALHLYESTGASPAVA